MADSDTSPAPMLAQFELVTNDRPLRLMLDLPGGCRNDLLLPQRAFGREAICGGLELRILCVSANVRETLKGFIGVPAELQIVTDRGQLRRICGIVTKAASGQSDGGLATYQLTIRDGLSVMESRVNTRVFRDKNELDVIKVLIDEIRANNPVLAATFNLYIDIGLAHRKLPPRDFIMQHNESDADFIRRLLQRRGIAWFIRPGISNQSSTKRQDDEAIGHTLVLFADPVRLKQNTAGAVRFHRDAATEQRDAITDWGSVRTLHAGSASLHSWRERNPTVGEFMTTRSRSLDNQGTRGNQLAAILDDYHVAAPDLGTTPDDLAELGDVQMAHYQYAAKEFHGEGGVRDFAVGEWFSLVGHPEIDAHPESERQFVITSQQIMARNNLPVDLGTRVERLFARNGWADDTLADDAGGKSKCYRTRFTCVRRGVRIVPPRPVMPRPHLQTALVVGPANDEVWCDHEGRVKIRFPATRPQDHVHASGAGSSDSDADSAWVRVASNWAGNGPGSSRQSGTRLLPTVGTEVLVGFAGGDPDQPVIIGQLYNGAALPPAFRHEGALPDTRYQSGLRSREVRGQRGNQLRLDDTPGQISAQVASDHATTELNLGYLTEPRHDGSAAPRGEGAELRTEESIALHAMRGILLSTWKLLGGAGAKGGQLARDDYLGLLRECGELCASLGNYASEHNGTPFDTKEQDELRARFRQWEDGSNTVPNAAARGEPVIGVTSPAGIGFASSKAIISYSARNIDTVAQQHLQLTAGQRFTVNAGQGASLFAHHGGIKAIAHHGKLLLQSQHDDTVINAGQDVQITACDGTVTISAKVLVLATEDGSFFRMGDGGPVIGSKQPVRIHAPDFEFDGPQTMTIPRTNFGEGGADQQLELRFRHGVPGEDGALPQGARVRDTKMNVALSDGSSAATRSDAHGKSELFARDAMHTAHVELLRTRGGD